MFDVTTSVTIPAAVIREMRRHAEDYHSTPFIKIACVGGTDEHLQVFDTMNEKGIMPLFTYEFARDQWFDLRDGSCKELEVGT